MTPNTGRHVAVQLSESIGCASLLRPAAAMIKEQASSLLLAATATSVATASSIVAFDLEKMQPTHGSLCLMGALLIAELLHARLTGAARRLDRPLAILMCLDGLAEAIAFLTMPPDKSAQWLGGWFDGTPSLVSVVAPPCVAMICAALAASKLPRTIKLISLIASSCGWGLVLPIAVAFVHGRALGLRIALALLYFVLLPGMGSAILMTLWCNPEHVSRAVRWLGTQRLNERGAPEESRSGDPASTSRSLMFTPAAGACFAIVVALMSLSVGVDPWLWLQGLHAPMQGSTCLIVVLVLSELLHARLNGGTARLDRPLAIYLTLDGIVLSLLFVAMPSDSSALLMEHVFSGTPSRLSFISPAVVLVASTLSASELPGLVKLFSLVASCCNVGLVFPSAVAYVHGEALGLRAAKAMFYCMVLPTIVSTLLTTLWCNRSRVLLLSRRCLHVGMTCLVLAFIALVRMHGHSPEIQPLHATLFLLLGAGVLHATKSEWAPTIWIGFFCLNGPATNLVMALMPLDASAAFVHRQIHAHIQILFMGTTAGVASEVMADGGIVTRREQLIFIVCNLIIYGILSPAATLIVHGDALGADHAKASLALYIIPLLLGTGLTRLIAMEIAEADPPPMREVPVHAPPVLASPGPPPLLGPVQLAIPMLVPVPVVVPPIPAPMPVMVMLPPDEEHDLNDSDSTSLSSSRSSDGDSEILEQWGPAAFGEEQEDEHGGDAV